MVSNAGTNISEKLGTTNILLTWIIGVFVATPLLCFPEVAEMVFGSDYATHNFRITFSLVVLCTCIRTFKAGLARVLAANSLLWWGFFSNTFWAAILIVSTLFLVRWGAPGLAAALAIAYVLNTVVLIPLYYSRNLVPRGTLFSFEAGFIWLILGGLVYMNIVDTILVFRIVIFIPCLVLLFAAFYRILKQSVTKGI